MGIQGQGEHSFILLLERLEKGGGLAGIPGLYLPGKGLQGKMPIARHLDDCPLPLPGVHISVPANLQDQPIWLPVQTRRGCPLKCSYCSTPLIEGTLLRRRDTQQTVDFLREYVSVGFDRFFFVDNVFNFPPAYTKRLCMEILKRNLKIKWRCILYPWKAGEELIRMMALAGCEEVSLGFESGSARIIKAMNKRYSPEEVRHISLLLKKYGIRTMGFLLLGGPGEDRDTVMESLIFADSLALEAMRITVGVRIYPHTPLAREAITVGMIRADDDLLFPKFYIRDDLKMWTLETVQGWIAGRPHWFV